MATSTQADGLYRHGIGARAAGLAGADVAWAESPLSALGSNPAALGRLRSPSLDLGVIAAIPEGEFANRAITGASLDSGILAAPDLGLSLPIGKWPATVGLAFIPEMGLSAEWNYVDTPGGANGTTSYGLQPHESEITLLRGALGVGFEISPKFWAGASVGFLYNENRLNAPYIFQEHPIIRGVKTLLNLETSGFGVNGQIGFIYQPCPTVRLGIRYESESRIYSDGDADGNLSAQFQSLGGGFAGARPDFHYDAEVVNTFPHRVSGGLSWEINPKLRAAFQVDWINWDTAFESLPIHLTQGNNADINGLLGSPNADDTIPLNWRDQVIGRIGVEYQILDEIALRGGYSYGRSPVPDGTLTPLTAVIPEHTLAFGVGFRRGRWQIDFAYQYDLPTERHVGTSDLLSGEYSNSEIEVQVHWISLTTSFRF